MMREYEHLYIGDPIIPLGDQTPQPNFLKTFEAWALRRGKLGPGANAIPQFGMRSRTIENYVYRLSRILSMTEPPYLVGKSVQSEHLANGTKTEYPVAKGTDGRARDIRNITPSELISGMDNMFPMGILPENSSNYRHYQAAAVKFCQWLIYGLKDHDRPIWTTGDLKEFSDVWPWVRVRYPSISIIEPEQFDPFLDWMLHVEPARKCDPSYRELHDAAYAMRWIGLRYEGMRGIDKYLSGKVVFEGVSGKLARDRIIIHEKHTPRDFQMSTRQRTFLKGRMAYMKEHWPDCPTLLCNTRGKPWLQATNAFNATLRKAWTRYTEESLEQEVDRSDMDGCHAHALRHTCAVYLVKLGVSFPVIKAMMGHADYKTLGIYVVHVNKSGGEEIDRLEGEKDGKR